MATLLNLLKKTINDECFCPCDSGVLEYFRYLQNLNLVYVMLLIVKICFSNVKMIK